MRVLHVHNFYQLPGGEDQCFASTGAMLKDHGHEVVPFTLDNDAVATVGKVATATTAVWNSTTYRELRRLIRTTRPDVAHFENTFPLVSPAAYYACHAEGVPVLQMLHNFRIVCPSAILYRAARYVRTAWASASPGPASGTVVTGAVVSAARWSPRWPPCTGASAPGPGRSMRTARPTASSTPNSSRPASIRTRSTSTRTF
jgi:hypothetical protein